jgi:hypothetical protein
MKIKFHCLWIYVNSKRGYHASVVRVKPVRGNVHICYHSVKHTSVNGPQIGMRTFLFEKCFWENVICVRFLQQRIEKTYVGSMLVDKSWDSITIDTSQHFSQIQYPILNHYIVATWTQSKKSYFIVRSYAIITFL